MADDLDRLLKARSTFTIKGRVFAETKESITIQTQISLFEIPLKFVSDKKNVGEEAEFTVARDAQIVQKLLITGEEMAGVVSGAIFRNRFPSTFAGECDCSRCVCDCRCECDCSRCTSARFFNQSASGAIDATGLVTAGGFFRRATF